MAAVFQSACAASTDFNTTGANTTFGGTNGMLSTLGSAPSLRVNASGSAYVFEGVEKTLPSNSTIFGFAFQLESAATVYSGMSIFTVWTDATYTASSSPFRLDIASSGSGYILNVVDPSNSYAGTAGTTTLSKGLWYEIYVQQTSAGWKVWINDGASPEITYTHTQGTVGYPNVTWGTHYQNAATSVTGYMDFSNIWVGNLNTAPSTTAQQIADAYQGYKQRHLGANGMIYRGPADGNNASGTSGYPDSVSEACAYFLKLAVQNNDQSGFIAGDNWVLQNMLRSVSTTGNTSNNAAPSTALNLMAFHFNAGNSDGKGPGSIYDANDATDADPERAQALLWAHARWGSSSYTVGTTNELTTPNYLQRALNVIADLRTYRFSNSTTTGYNYLENDSFQHGNATIQMGGDYHNPAAYKLFAQYDTGNATFWNNAVSGVYDAHNKAAAVIFTGASPAQSTTANLNPDWFSFTLSGATVGTTPSTYGDSDYGYNAFRIYNRLYDMYTWYSDANALTALQKPKSFFASEYSANSKIRATFKHDGTNTGNYENNMFTWVAYFVSKANDSGNTTASALKTNKLTSLYMQQPFGSIISEAPNAGSAAYGYFGQSWSLVNFMQDNGLWTNYGQTSTNTKTQTGTARITKTITNTITGKSRLQKTNTATQTGVTRITNTVTKTQLGTARLQKTGLTKTQTGVSRISKTNTATQTGTARLTKTNTKTQAGISRISKTFTNTINGVSRVSGNKTATQTGVARIANAGILINSITGKARITNTVNKTQTGLARLQKTGLTATQTGKSRISNSRTATQPGTARITNSRTATQTGTARIVKTNTNAITGVSRITGSPTKTQLGTARLTKTNTKTQTGTARISKTNTATQTGKSRLAKSFTNNQNGVARISKTGTNTISGTARIQPTVNTRTATQTGTARISGTNTAYINGTARINHPIPATFERITHIAIPAHPPITINVNQGTPIKVYINP